MSNAFLNMVQKDVQFITGPSGDFSVPLKFTTPDGTKTVTISGLSTKHSINMQGEGADTIDRNTHASVSELLLIAAGYPVRNANNEVDMKSHLVAWTDISGVEKTYKIQQCWPDEKLGILLFPALSKYKAV